MYATSSAPVEAYTVVTGAAYQRNSEVGQNPRHAGLASDSHALLWLKSECEQACGLVGDVVADFCQVVEPIRQIPWARGMPSRVGVAATRFRTSCVKVAAGVGSFAGS